MISFELLPCLKVEQLITALSDKVKIRPVAKHYCLKTYYDSFDWRLYKHDLICEFNRTKDHSTLTLINRKKYSHIISTPTVEVPPFTWQLNPGKIRHILEPILEMRALITCCTLECEAHHFDVLDENDNIILRLLIEEFELLNNRLTLLPVKNHDKVVKQLAGDITADPELGLYPVNKSVLLDGLKLLGRQPKDYSSELAIALTVDMPAEVACKTIFHCLLRVIKNNEQGTMASIDSEFLHDFRVAIRKTRVGLNQVDGILPEETVQRYKEFFSWLGQITSETRDLDVYLLNFEKYRKTLPANFRQSITPLQNLLLAKKTKAQKQLAKKLQSNTYLKTITEWETYLTTATPHEGDVKLVVKELADQKIWKAYKQVLKQGNAIDDDSAPEALHQLRKTCKKLRYLMELFQSLYKEQRSEKLIKNLKRLQNVLGEYQDCAVHQEQLQQFSEEMQAINTPNRTFLAIGGLIQTFETRKTKARKHFAAEFEHFKQPENHAAFHALFTEH